MRKCSGGRKAEKEEREASGSPRSGTHYTFEFLKGIVIVSRPSEEVESASVSHAGAREERSEARLALGWSPGRDPTALLMSFCSPQAEPPEGQRRGSNSPGGLTSGSMLKF